jgi:hypothetical protein
MKRIDLIRNPQTGVSQPVPRHRESEDILAKHILGKWKAGPE